jgi:lysine 2,3-aminomutase
VLRNYEQKTFHYPQPKPDAGRELPMVGAGQSWNSSLNGCDGGLENL